MNVHEAKQVLLLYRPGTADALDAEIAQALALAKVDPELARWLESQSARQGVIGEQFRQIIPPAGLKAQIISERAAAERAKLWRPKAALVLVTALICGLGLLAWFWPPKAGPDETLAIYQNQMVGIALRGYGMDLTTNDPVQIRAHLAQNAAPADFDLPPALQSAAVAGCAVKSWQDKKVSMICFRTGKPLPPGESADLWLFVVDRSALNVATVGTTPQFAKVNRLITATWTKGDKIYLLGTAGEEPAIRPYL
jgi:hypothetical protein